MKGGFSEYLMPKGRNTSYTDKKKITGITFFITKNIFRNVEINLTAVLDSLLIFFLLKDLLKSSFD